MKTSCLDCVRNKFAVASGIALIAAMAAGPASAYTPSAPDNYQFELDGNLVPGTRTDWKDLFDVIGDGIPTPKAVPPAGFGSSSFTRDFTPGSTADESTFATGSKDTLNISGGWQCSKSNNLGDKVDLINAYATSYLDPDTSETIIYFGLETASNEGTRDVGFWFLRDGSVDCSASTGKNVNFTGNHRDGDILVTAEYNGSNGVSLVKVFRWNGGASGSLSEVASGRDCASAASTDAVCGSTNTSPLRRSQNQVPWLTRTKTSNPSVPGLTSADLDVGEFFEGGLNLTRLGLNTCFGRFLANTRSSATPNATIFDFTVGNFSTCSISVGLVCTGAVIASDAERAATGKNFKATFNAAIRNTGGAALPSGTTVVFVHDAGTPGDTSDDITINQTLVNGLAAGATGPTIVGVFYSNLQSPTGIITATATVGGTQLTATSPPAGCTADIVSALSVVKNCGIPAALNGGVEKPGTELIQQGGVLVVQVNVSGQVCYDDPNAAATVPYLNVTAGNQLGLNPLAGVLGTPITLSKTQLLPTECATFAFSYQPPAGDGSTSPASDGAFTDTVSARGTHPALTAEQRPFNTDNARCTICPCTGPSCPAP